MSNPGDLFYGLFQWHVRDGDAWVSRHEAGPANIPCPTTGRLLRVATIDAEAAAICPRCSSHARGGFVSFVGDLRMAYACPSAASWSGWREPKQTLTFQISDFRFQTLDFRLAILRRQPLVAANLQSNLCNQNLKSSI